MSNTMTDAELAADLAQSAGRILMELRDSGLLAGKSLGEAGDQAANEFLVHALREQRPDDGLLSEESKDTEERLSKSRVWIVDPVDGTREYGEGRSDWAVHVALAIDGVASIGAVALPGLDGGVVLRTDKIGKLVPMGSAGAKAMAVVRGEAEIYLHSGGQFEWDSCAPVAVASAYGLHCSRIDGSSLVYNQQDTYMPDLLICRQGWANKVFDVLKV
jgi:3'(2'), 5'-bisphosphate nucleotidase